MNRLEKIRQGFTDMRGGKLISIEAYILGIIIAFVMIVVRQDSPYLSLIIAFIVGFIFPIIVGTFKGLALVAAITFSLMWGLISVPFTVLCTGGSFVISTIIAIVVFIISFFIHKNYSGFTFQKISRKKIKVDNVFTENSRNENSVKFCPKCGRRIGTSNGLCSECYR